MSHIGTYKPTWADLYISSDVFLDGSDTWNNLDLGAFADFGIIFSDGTQQGKTITGFNHHLAEDVRAYMDDDTAMLMKIMIYNVGIYNVTLMHNSGSSDDENRIFNTGCFLSPTPEADVILKPNQAVELKYYSNPMHGFKYFLH